MSKVLAIFLGKCLIIVGKFVGKGSSLPGRWASKIDKKIITKFKLPPIRIAVTGSSGKGSTSTIIADLLRADGKSVAHNTKGSNLKDGIVTLLLENCTLTGKVKKDALVYEIDERFTKFVFPYITPNYVVITNITRDQPPRQGNFDLVFAEIEKSLTPEMHLILNGDDPYLRKFNLNEKIPVTYYTLDCNHYSYTNSKFTSLNICYCPKCHQKLLYDDYHFETLGHYHCPNCGLQNPESPYHITDLDYTTKTMTINHQYPITFQYDILFSVYNTMAAYVTASLLEIAPDIISNTLNEIGSNEKIYSHYQAHNHQVYVLNNKNENSTTFNQSLLFIDRYKSEKTIVIGWKEISRRYEFNDLSWLYDIDFELLKDHPLKQVICVGINCYDLAVRMKYAGIDIDKIKIFDSLEDAKETILEGEEDIFAILNFDYVDPFNAIVQKEEQS